MLGDTSIEYIILLQASPEYLAMQSDSDAPLFDGSPHSVLQILVNCFQLFCEHPGISKEALSSMLAMQKSLLPAPHNLPGSYETSATKASVTEVVW